MGGKVTDTNTSATTKKYLYLLKIKEEVKSKGEEKYLKNNKEKTIMKRAKDLFGKNLLKIKKENRKALISNNKNHSKYAADRTPKRETKNYYNS